MTEIHYDVILADPPWTFSVWNAEKSDRHVSHKYNLMSVAEICALPVRFLAADNCALFLWATWPNLLDALQVVTAWGFEYRTSGFVWVKANSNYTGFFTGLGYYTRANTELCLLAIKGRMAVANHGVSELIYSPVREHSRKPDEQYGKVERLYPGRRYLELFARRRWSAHWDVWGNEVENDIEMKCEVVA